MFKMNNITDPDTYPMHLVIYFWVEFVFGGPFIYEAKEFLINPK